LLVFPSTKLEKRAVRESEGEGGSENRGGGGGKMAKTMYAHVNKLIKKKSHCKKKKTC
jgi:hypothetical protein